MAYLADRAVNLLNAHYGLRYIGIAGGAAFFVPHLIKAGATLPIVFLAIAAILAGRFVMRPLLIPLARRTGLRALVIAGTLLCALQFPAIAGVDGIGARFALFIAVSAVGDTVYWTTIHAYFAQVGTPAERGRHLGARESFVALAGMISPLAAGYLLATVGPAAGFAVGTVATAAAVLPLLFAPEVAVADVAPGASAAPSDSLQLFHADGWLGGSTAIVWSTVLFVSLGETFTAYGGAMALAALIGAAGALLLGGAIDRKVGRRVVLIAVGAMAVAAGVKAMTTGSAPLATLANALGALAGCLFVPTLMTPIYNTAREQPCALRFHVATEGAWDLGAIAALTLTAAMVALGAPPAAGMSLALGSASRSARWNATMPRARPMRRDAWLDVALSHPEQDRSRS
jgi:MFS transporter, DHA1 family, inner membrane transport protein